MRQCSTTPIRTNSASSVCFSSIVNGLTKLNSNVSTSSTTDESVKTLIENENLRERIDQLHDEKDEMKEEMIRLKDQWKEEIAALQKQLELQSLLLKKKDLTINELLENQ